MTATSTADALADASQAPVEHRADLIRSAMHVVGWGEESITRVTGRLPRGVVLLQAAVATEPKAGLVISGAGDGMSAARANALSYSREAPYTVWWNRRGIELHATHVWRESPGDTPVMQAVDAGGTRALLELVSPRRLIGGAVADIATGGRPRDGLSPMLAKALATLRVALGNTATLAGLSTADVDAEALRLFHQLLHVRFLEDDGDAVSATRVKDLISEPRPQDGLIGLLAEYGDRLDSELFEQTSRLPVELPAQATRDVLRALVEPWAGLRLNFSVTRSELAGRLYQSYLRLSPAVTEAEPETGQRQMWPVVRQADRRSVSAAYYTPTSLAHMLAHETLGPWLEATAPTSPAGARVVDPACGSGAFLLAAYRELLDYFGWRGGGALKRAGREAVLRESVFGVDKDPHALSLAQVQLLEEARLGVQLLPRLRNNLRHGDSLNLGADDDAPVIDWQAMGAPFDVLLTNPPFGSMKRQAGQYRPDQREHLRDRYGGGRAHGADLAYYFVALADEIVAPGGSAGYVLPRTFLSGRSGRSIRGRVSERVRRVVDFRSARLFGELDVYVAVLVTGPGAEPTVTEIVGRATDRDVVVASVLDDDDPAHVTLTVASETLVRRAGESWAPFDLRWHTRFADSIGVGWEPLAEPDGSGARRVVHGTQTGADRAFTVPTDEWHEIDADRVLVVPTHVVPVRYAPLLVDGVDIRPFTITPTGRRLIVPYDEDGRPTADPEVLSLVEERGGAPRNPQPGALGVLRGPKVLIRRMAREPAAAADLDGRFVCRKGLAGALAVAVDESRLRALVTLLNSSLYQWLLRGRGQSKARDHVDLTVAVVASLPWPDLDAVAWGSLSAAHDAVASALDAPDSSRFDVYWEARAVADRLVMDLLGVAAPLRQAVESELVRPA